MGESIDGDRRHFGVFHGKRQLARADSGLWRHADQGAVHHRLLVLGFGRWVDMPFCDRTCDGSSSNVRHDSLRRYSKDVIDMVENEPNLVFYNP